MLYLATSYQIPLKFELNMDQDLIDFRKELHSYPELSGEEKETAKRIIQKLKEFNPTEIIDNLGGHGVAAIYDSGNSGKTLLFRADTDALPIQEVNDFSHKSVNNGISHKCGHDGHSTIMIGFAKKLHQQPLKHGKVILLFQPAEEIGEGARAVLEDKKFANFKPDYAFALHNVPGFPKGQIVCRKGTFNPAAISLVIKMQGKQAHAAQQENGINPDKAIASLMHQIQQLHNPDLNSENFIKFTTIYTRIGSKNYGISAGDGELHYTIRCWKKEQLEKAKKQLIELITKTCEENKLSFTIDWIYYFAASNNDSYAVDCIKTAAKLNQFDYFDKPLPFQWGEDFGLFTENIPGAMFGLGAGKDTPALHHNNYDFPDEIIPYGVDTFYSIAKIVTGNQDANKSRCM